MLPASFPSLPHKALALQCQATELLGSFRAELGSWPAPAPPTQGSHPQPPESLLSQAVDPAGKGGSWMLALGQAELSAGHQGLGRKPHNGLEGRQPCVPQARRSPRAYTSLPGCWRCSRGRAGPRPPRAAAGMGQPVGSARLGPAPALASPAALGDPLKARLALGRAGRRSDTGWRNATSSPERDQTIRAKASNQILPPPWETTQQHSRYLPG